MSLRRKFFKQAAGIAGALTAASGFSSIFAREEAFFNKLSSLSIHGLDAAQQEDFWSWVQQAYSASPNVINLNNGGVSPQPLVVQDALDRYVRLSNEAPSYYMWRTLDEGRESVRMKLADLAGCSPEEVMVNRNATEALETIIFGLQLQKGDEVVLALQDYPNMLNAWKQRAQRDGILLKFVSLSFPGEDPEIFVNKYMEKVTKKTRVVHLTHMINWVGQIMPCAQISQAVKAFNPSIDVVIDAAHTFAHLDFKIPDLGGDFVGTSLHKWLCAPFGTGMLYITKERIGDIWPMYGAQEPKSGDIRKFEAMGTRSFPIEMAVGHAVNFHNAIGSARKQQRLHYLKHYWLSKVVEMKGIKTNTSLLPEHSCALASIYIEGMEPAALHHELFKRSRIHTTYSVWENIQGVRITPHVYTPLKDLDRLVETIGKIAKDYAKV
jgi:selenocysteine lyase/cysteine desulfurase